MGVVGVGGFGRSHLGAVESLASAGRAHLVAVADPFREQHVELDSRLSAQGVAWHSTLEEMLEKETLDAITIATPVPLHFGMTRRAVEKGVFVYLEKPPVPLLSQLDEMIAWDEDFRVAVGFQLIYSEPIRFLKQAILDGKLGTVRSIRGGAAAPRRQSYYNRASWAGRMSINGEPVFDGPMTNALAHVLQNILFLGGGDAWSFARPTSLRGELYRCYPVESFDTSCVRGVLDTGVEFAFAGSHAVRDESPHTLEVVGTRGTLRLTGGTFSSDIPGLELPQHAGSDVPMLASVSRFMDYVCGQPETDIIRLEDTRGFVETTNGTLVSSRGIFPLDARFVESYQVEGDPGLDVLGLGDLITQTITTGRLFSENSAPWANRTPTVTREEIQSAVLEEWIFGAEENPKNATACL